MSLGNLRASNPGYSVLALAEDQLHLAEGLRLHANVVDHLRGQSDLRQTVQLLYDAFGFKADGNSAVKRRVCNVILVNELRSGQRLCNSCQKVGCLQETKV